MTLNGTGLFLTKGLGLEPEYEKFMLSDIKWENKKNTIGLYIEKNSFTGHHRQFCKGFETK